MDRLAISTNAYIGYTLEEALEGISSAGFGNVELNICENGEWTRKIDSNLTDEEIRQFKDMFAAYGVRPITLSGFGHVVVGSRRRELLSLIPVARKLGCKYIIDDLATAPGETAELEKREDIVSALREIGTVCEANGIRLLLELHGAYASGHIMGSVVREVGMRSVAVNYDIANIIYFTGTQPYADLLENLDVVGGVHIKDKLGGKGVWNFPAVGRGETDIPRIVRILKDSGFSGAVTAEIEYTPAGPGSLAVADEAVRETCEYLTALGVG